VTVNICRRQIGEDKCLSIGSDHALQVKWITEARPDPDPLCQWTADTETCPVVSIDAETFQCCAGEDSQTWEQESCEYFGDAPACTSFPFAQCSWSQGPCPTEIANSELFSGKPPAVPGSRLVGAQNVTFLLMAVLVVLAVQHFAKTEEKVEEYQPLL